MKKNLIITLEIVGTTAEGMGVGRHNGVAVFVAGAALGDIISCKIVKVLKNYSFGIIVEIIEPSSSRVEPDCPAFKKCGGCVFRHINYRAELEIKENRVKDALSRIGGFDNIELEPIVGDENRCRYRNKAQIPIGVDKNGTMVMGFYAAHSHSIIEIEDCLLQPECFTAAMNVLKYWHNIYKVSVYNQQENTGILRHLYLRFAEKTNSLMVCVVINSDKLPFSNELVMALKEKIPNVASVILNINKEETNVVLGEKNLCIYGEPWVEDQLCGLKFRISPLAFYQVNRTQAEKLYLRAAQYANLKGGEVLVDLYCGTGTIGLSMSKNAKKVIGVEVIFQAIENANENAKLNNVKNAEFICGDAAKIARILEKRGEKPNVVLIDPPRKGCAADAIEATANMQPEKVVYISCDPATLARDLKIFAQLGYSPIKAAVFDLFPATAHVETVVLLEKNKRETCKCG